MRANITSVGKYVPDRVVPNSEFEKFLETKMTSRTKRIIHKQNVPRKKISDGLSLDIYKRCGWEAPDPSLSEKEELEKRRHFAIEQGASDQALKVLDKLCVGYESNYYKASERRL